MKRRITIDEQGANDGKQNKTSTITSENTPSSWKTDKPPKKVFQFGNYNQYYGYRNPSKCDDGRLAFMSPCWFKEKTVLDIGCNTGHLTLSLARKFLPKRVDAIDIDKDLIGIARRNISHYEGARNHNGVTNINNNETVPDKPVPEKSNFKTLFQCSKATIEAPKGPKVSDIVNFSCSNYVLSDDSMLNMCKHEYDVILMLSVSKWIHLNFADDGLKRCFNRVFKQLKSPGIFLFEPQPFESYKKKRKLTPEISQTFQNIQFLPKDFDQYLKDIGFRYSMVLNRSAESTTSFDKRPLVVYFKCDENFDPPCECWNSRM
ncbi:7SK snRNA methylphosphate capping enzyme-like isoform X1 [Convolutriloba macropyga]|uniref:7SK snRNA methylphosphate capping enzyme-like isoform X1 n=1 Tax=Convolutriloba macropyga TaxID=536237 RepID=UPI003F51D7F5